MFNAFLCPNIDLFEAVVPSYIYILFSVRLDAHDSKLIAIQNLDLNDIEAELKRLYNTSPEDMLSPLFSMLTLIQNFPVGDYLLKFNPKFSDKLMVYSKASTKYG